MSDTAKTLTINGSPIAFSEERNLLELCRKAGIDIPTFCYHSELSIYGACRLCLVDDLPKQAVDVRYCFLPLFLV